MGRTGRPRRRGGFPCLAGGRLCPRSRARRGRRVDGTMSGDRKSVVAAAEHAGIVAVIRIKEPERLKAVVDAIAEGGIRVLEVTMTVPGAVQLIADLAPRMPAGFLLGAGTVVDAETAGRVIDAGAQFIVSPVFRPDVVARCRQHNVAALPG